MIGSSLFIVMLHTFSLACVGSWWPSDEFGIVSVIHGIVKYKLSSKLKPTLFPEGGDSISYVGIVLSLNGVDLRSCSHGIKLRRS